MEKGDDGIYERNGQKFHFTIQVRDYEEERVDIANVMSDMLKQAGVEMEVKLVTKFDWDGRIQWDFLPAMQHSLTRIWHM